MGNDCVVRARIPFEVKEKAMQTLEQMGINVSYLIRMLLFKIATEGRIPFSLEVPNQETIDAVEELERGDCKEYESVEEMMKDLFGQKLRPARTETHTDIFSR